MIRNPAFLLSALCLTSCAATFAQSDDAVQLPTVTVTSTLPADDVLQQLEAEQALTPGGVTLVDSDTLYQRNVSNLADLLRYVPGVWAASGSTGDTTFFSSRGSNLDATNYDGNGIKLSQDGLPVTTADGNNHNRAIDPLSARYAVIARGANALTYGASTLGGAIDFVTPTARDLDAIEVYLNGGSNGQVQGRVSAGAVVGDFDGLVTAEARHWDGYREHHEQDRQGLYANAGWQFSDTLRTRFYFTFIDNDQELPGALTRDEWREDPEQAQASAVSGDYRLNVETWRVANKTSWDIDASSSLSIGFSYENQQLYHPIVYSPFFSLLIDTEQDTAATALRYNRRAGAHNLLAGLNYAQTEVRGGNYDYREERRSLSTRVDNDADNLELFVVDRWQFAPGWIALYGAQGVIGSREVRNTTVSDGSLRNPRGDYDSINPRVGLIYQLTPEIELFGNLSRLYEAPTNFELEDDARGNQQALDAMHGTVAEVGSRGTQALGPTAHWYWDLALYYAELNDEILSVDDPRAPGTSLSTNVDATIHAGVEALVGASFALDGAGSHRIEPLLSLTLNHFRFDGDASYGDNDLPAAPGYVIRGELLYRNAGGYFAGPTFDVIDDRYADFSNSYTVDAYTLLGLRAGLARKTWEVFAEVRNLADKDYISQFSVKDSAAANAAILTPGEPRSAYAGVRLRF